MLDRQLVPLGRGIVGEVTGDRLCGQPFGDQPGIEAGVGGDLGRGARPGTGHRPVEAETVADHRHGGGRRGRKVGAELPGELLDPRLVDLGGGCGGCHALSLRICTCPALDRGLPDSVSD
nr:hypothetical protein [Pseudonocardia asaccharolytica]